MSRNALPRDDESSRPKGWIRENKEWALQSRASHSWKERKPATIQLELVRGDPLPYRNRNRHQYQRHLLFERRYRLTNVNGSTLEPGTTTHSVSSSKEDEQISSTRASTPRRRLSNRIQDTCPFVCFKKSSLLHVGRFDMDEPLATRKRAQKEIPELIRSTFEQFFVTQEGIQLIQPCRTM